MFLADKTMKNFHKITRIYREPYYMPEDHGYKDLVLNIGGWLMQNYWGPIYRKVKENPDLLETIPGFLLKPEKLIFYMGRKHIAIEYLGPERIKALPDGGYPLSTRVFDYSLENTNLLEEIIGFKYTTKFTLPLPSFVDDLVWPTSAGVDQLSSLGWNWEAQDAFIAFGAGGFEIKEGQFTRLINARFYDANEADGLKTRHIKWIDFIPCVYDESDPELDSFNVWLKPYEELVDLDLGATYPVPDDFRLDRLQLMNRFVEFIGNKNNDEPTITRQLASSDLRFVLKMRFSAKEILAERVCEWQGTDRKAIKPDFFVVNPNGYADIVEFKLPTIETNTIVGSANREMFSSAISSYIAQTRVYRDYFDDPRNREYVKITHGIDVYKPRRHLVVGRRWNFSNDEWRSIAADYPDLTIHTYDDLIDGVVMQFYN